MNKEVTSSQSGGKKEGKSVSGTIGVMKRSAVVDPDSCRLCSLTSPPGLTRGKGKKGKCVDWGQCDGCDGWFHQICSGLSAVPEKWFCKDCEQSECSPTVD